MYWLPHDTAETDGLKQPYRYPSYHPSDLRPFVHFSPNGGCSLAGGCNSSISNIVCCIWNGEAETGTLSRFNCTAMLTYDPCEIRYERSSCTIRLKQLVYQRLYLLCLQPDVRSCNSPLENANVLFPSDKAATSRGWI